MYLYRDAMMLLPFFSVISLQMGVVGEQQYPSHPPAPSFVEILLFQCTKMLEATLSSELFWKFQNINNFICMKQQTTHCYTKSLICATENLDLLFNFVMTTPLLRSVLLCCVIFILCGGRKKSPNIIEPVLVS